MRQGTLTAIAVCWFAHAVRAQVLDAAEARTPSQEVPGVVIDHASANSGRYIGSPSIAILGDGAYVASHDWFGPNDGGGKVTEVFISADRGKTWSPQAEIIGQYWSTLFCLHDDLYLLGVDREFGHVAIRRSSDRGKTWTQPINPQNGLLLQSGKFHCAPGAVAVAAGRIWRAIEDAGVPGGRPHFHAFLISAPVDRDLLVAANWARTEPAIPGNKWLDAQFDGWLEGNVVPTPDHRLVDLLRVNRHTAGETAAIVRLADNGFDVGFNPDADFIHFPGGNSKFTVRFDEQSGAYFSLSNYIPPGQQNDDPNATRNTLALIRSTDLRSWSVQHIVLSHPDRSHHAFQYVDWQFDGPDLVAVSRTAFDDDSGGANSYHNANFLTFHRIEDFRSLSPQASTAADATVREQTDDFTITGTGFTLSKLDDGAAAFSNRKYVWQDVPPSLRGGQITQTAGGAIASIELQAKRSATLYAATGPTGADLAGWTPMPKFTFGYNDSKQSRMKVWQKQIQAGEKLSLPQGGWTGTLLLLPIKNVIGDGNKS